MYRTADRARLSVARIHGRSVGKSHPAEVIVSAWRKLSAGGLALILWVTLLVGVFAPPALAAAPEAPEVAVGAVHSETANLHGVLNPGKTGGPGTYELDEYQFLYNVGTACTGGSVVPTSAGISLGGGHEELPTQELSGLKPSVAYAVCLRATNGKHEATTSSAQSFTTVPLPGTDEVKPITATTATLNGHFVLSPSADTTYVFIYKAGNECNAGNSSAIADAGAGTEQKTVSDSVKELQPDTQYTVCLVTSNAFGEEQGSPRSFTTSTGVPVVGQQSISEVGSSSAILHATVDPAGLSTAYHFDYVDDGTFQSDRGSGDGFQHATRSPASDVGLGNGNSALSIRTQLSGLRSSTVYHFRVVATNEDGTVTSDENGVHTLTTLPTAVEGLPDSRVYEPVTPSEGQNANVYVLNTGALGGAEGALQQGVITELPVFRAAFNGDAVAYVGDPTTQGNGLSGQGGGNQFLATRASDGGWTQAAITPPEKPRPEVRQVFQFYQSFSSDLSVGIVESYDPLANGAPPTYYRDLYARSSTDNVYRPLFTGIPPHTGENAFATASVPSNGVGEQQLLYAGGSADSSHLLFEANDSLAVNAPLVSEQENNLYDSVGGQPYLVNVLPNGTTEANATFGAVSSAPFARGPDFSHVISNDGSRIFWTDLTTNEIFVRENDTSTNAQTIQIDASQAPGHVGGGGHFWTATGDGSTVFFTDENALTVDATAVPGAPDLYRYDLASKTLTDLTVDSHIGEHASVRGVIGASEDGSYVYFVAGGALAGTAKNESCEPEDQASGCNLYVVHQGEAPRFVATLSAQHDGERAYGGTLYNGDWTMGLGQRTAQVASQSGDLAFMSNRAVVAGAPAGVTEVYTYRPTEGDGRGAVCVSCSRSGELPPVAETDEQGQTAGFLPTSDAATYMPRTISADGARVIFNSTVPLVTQDQNGRRDVYEWERSGAGSCRETSGCIYLLSGGTSTTDSTLLDASENGNDVFIITRTALGEGPESGVDKIYDARVNGTRPLVAPACSGTGCQGVPSPPPLFATPPSVTFQGVGNFPSSPAKHVVRRRAKAQTRAQKRREALRACRKLIHRYIRRGCEGRVKRRYGSKAATRGLRPARRGQ